MLGNPAARVRLIEYASYTCPHCAHFSAESSAALRTRYIAPGRVAFEFRHLVRDPVDFAMAVAANCGPASGFFARSDALFAQQTAIINRVRALPEERVAQWRLAPEGQRLLRVAQDTGIDVWMRGRGLTAAQVNACLTDQALQQRLIAMTNGASQRGVNSTPSFLLNDVLQGPHEWGELQPALDAAVTGGA